MKRIGPPEINREAQPAAFAAESHIAYPKTQIRAAPDILNWKCPDGEIGRRNGLVD